MCLPRVLATCNVIGTMAPQLFGDCWPDLIPGPPRRNQAGVESLDAVAAKVLPKNCTTLVCSMGHHRPTHF